MIRLKKASLFREHVLGNYERIDDAVCRSSITISIRSLGQSKAAAQCKSEATGSGIEANE